MIYIENLKKTLADRDLFEIEDLAISENDKVALIGDNGVGKTTFFRLILGLDREYSGRVSVDRSMDYLLNVDTEDKNFSREIYSKAQLKENESYSPGEYRRLKLLDLLVDELSFLLLDEPTSHLDMDQKEELIERLKARRLGYLIISHDRDFINKTCTKILELANGKIEVYNGDYKFYLAEREKRRKFQEREYENYAREKARLENLAISIKDQSAKVKTAPKRMGNSEARLHKMGGQGNKKKLDKQVKAVESRLRQLDVKERPKEASQIKLKAPASGKIHSQVLIRAEKLNKSFKDKILFDQANFIIENNSKVALLGENGCGKTTLLKMILDEEQVWVHPNLKIGYFSQMNDTLEDKKTILENILATSIYDQTLSRIVLGRLGFKNDDVNKVVELLSDGEKAKVKLAKILTADFNFLIFDEPTNFLDLRAIESLEELLKSYDRPIIFVSHDEEFINNLADRLLIIENKKLVRFKGSLVQYKNRKQQAKENNDEDKLLLDFRLSSINSRLAMDISKEERESLEEEYKNLLEKKI
ncbi:ribosomal protection-like ABC-F family protein [Neofamilia massiliensis]|uniref:ribosomal protection-like ABC-F family protein n=1 Tax=Neofamilia massiliensis TaxID=1673724 RepID=UPI0006BB6099|nr:ABC-F type ribosomal protection protein [Neofamilia massiliensis]